MSQRDSLVCVHSYLMRNTEKLLKEEERTTGSLWRVPLMTRQVQLLEAML